MNRSAVLHIPMSQYAYGTDEEHIVIRLRAGRGDLTECILHYGDRACRLTPVLFTEQKMAVVAQTEEFDYCIDATIKCGFEHGFKMIVPENANSTFDNAFMTGEQSYKYYNEFMWKGRYAECISVEETIEGMKVEVQNGRSY